MDQLLGVLPQLADLIQKSGVVGVLLIVCAVLVVEIKRGRTTIHDLRGQLQIVVPMLVKLQTLCEAHNVAVDMSDVRDLIDKLAPKPSPQ